MFVACKFSGKTGNILRWIFEPYEPPKEFVSHLLDGHVHLFVCKTIHVPPGPKKN